MISIHRIMDEHNELLGTVVLVHPRLSNDPAGRKNQIGIITSAELEQDDITVSFNEKEQALFSSDALLVLRDVDDIKVDALNDFTLLPFYDYGDIMDIIMLAGSPHTENRRAAVELSRGNPAAMEYTMNSLNNELALKQDQRYSR
jgi:hypothetical protein